jgi:ribonuclease P protein component
LSRQFTFGRNERLKSRKQIDALFTDGKKFVLQPFRIHYELAPATGVPLQFGIGVSSKVFRKAVDRNRIKRVARECWRLEKPALAEDLAKANIQLRVFVVYTSKEAISFHDLLPIVHKLTGKLRSLFSA